jgi:demethylmenaquinone methyltransferase/2-methoxy-6-polyprenyl-1,4-benzoquinol methylase
MAPIYGFIGGMLPRTGLKKSLEPKDGQKIIDAGGGTGLLRDQFGDFRFDPWLVLDVNRNMLRQGRRTRPSCRFVRGSATAMPLRDRTFDRVLISDALHHMPDRNQVLRESRRVLREDGKLVVEEINPSTPLGGLIEIGERMLCMGSRFVTPDQLAKQLRQAGFRILSNTRQQFLYHMIATPSADCP